MNALTAIGLLFLALAADPTDDAIIATVNGRTLTTRDLDAFLAIRGVHGEVAPAIREGAKRELVDRELIRQFLERRKTVADPESLAAAMRVAKQKLAPDAKDVPGDLAALGLDEQRVEHEVSLALAWNQHVQRTITDGQIREYWKAHQRRLDGTRLRVSQIILKYAAGESQKDAPQTTAKLKAIRDEIASGKKSLADAARDVSQSPSAEKGGDVGLIGPRGDLPEAVSQAVYKLEKGDISEVVLSPFGAHIVTVTAVEPGDLSLEDARPAIFKVLAEKLWDDTVASERKAAKIDK